MKKAKISLSTLVVVFALASAFAISNPKGQAKVYGKVSGVCTELTACTSTNNGQFGCSVTVDGGVFYSTSNCQNGTQVSAFVRQDS